ncbi:MAG TPA: hypothetical protein VE505_15300 [Vicinamibacterales bacterium]|jgi:hypothetical protein|nr:hypothetical protein [Vicinamibacterales bacterium]
MVDWSNLWTRFATGNIGLGVAMILAVGLVAWANRASMRDVLADDDPRWRAIARFAISVTLVFLVWGTLFDDWLQLIAEPYRLSRQWASQRVVFDPVPEVVRWVTVVLLLLSLVSMACLVARHIGGYAIQLGLLTVATVLWSPLFVLRQRADVIVGFGQETATGDTAATVGFSLFVVLKWSLGLASLLTSYLFALMLIAPVVTLVLDLFRLRVPRVTAEAQPFFAALGQHASQREEDSLHSRHRPIRRSV